MKQFAHVNQEPVTLTPDGGRRRILSHAPNLMLVELSFDANVTTWLHSHPHEQITYVVAGEIECLIENELPKRLSAGESVYFPPNIKHHIRTITDALLIDCFTPAREDFLQA